LGTSLHFILNIFSNKTYPQLSSQDSQAIQRVTARAYSLNRLDGTMTVRQNIHWAERSVSWKPAIMHVLHGETVSTLLAVKLGTISSGLVYHFKW